VKIPVFHSRVAGLAVVCAGVAVLASACSTASTTPNATPSSTATSNGIAAKPVAQIATTAYTAMESAVSVRMYGSIIESGQKYTMDLTMAPAGVRGSMTAPFDGAKAASIDFVMTKGKMYIRSDMLWRQVAGATIASLLNNRWVMLPASSVGGFPFSNAKSFIKMLKSGGLDTLRKDSSAGVKTVTTTVDGQPAIELSVQGAALYIATTGQPYPLEVRQGSGDALYFQYSAVPASISAPSHPLNFNNIGG
jgi:hypothetical protein